MPNSQRTTELTRLKLGGKTHSESGIDEVAPLGFSNITTDAPTGDIVPDGFLSVVSQSATSLVIAIRSGNTIYTFANDAGEGV